MGDSAALCGCFSQDGRTPFDPIDSAVKLCGGLPSLVLMDQPVESEQESAARMVLDLVGVFEAAEVLGITRSAFADRRRSHRTFPPPLAELRCGPVWFRWQIQAYVAEERRLGRRGWYGRRIAR
jgi:hypothetical protein